MAAVHRCCRSSNNVCVKGSRLCGFWGAIHRPSAPLTASEDRQIQDEIRQSGAALVFVGISTPKQERWMFKHRYAFPGVTMIGVGAAFDFHAGCTPQAPRWMQRVGLEWFFRLGVEPRRLWRRYLRVTPRFLPLWLVQFLKTVRESRA